MTVGMIPASTLLVDPRVYDLIRARGFTHTAARRWLNIGHRSIKSRTVGEYTDLTDEQLLNYTNFGNIALMITWEVRKHIEGYWND